MARDHKQVQQPWLNAIAVGLKSEEGRLMFPGSFWEFSLEGIEVTLGDEKDPEECKTLIKVRFGKVHIFEKDTLQESIREMLQQRYHKLCQGTNYTLDEAYEVYWNINKDRECSCKKMGSFEIDNVEIIKVVWNERYIYCSRTGRTTRQEYQV